MQISSRFTMAIHMFACIDTFTDRKMTSDFMAALAQIRSLYENSYNS